MGERYLDDPYSVDVKQIIIPLSLIAVASTTLYTKPINYVDQEIQDEIVARQDTYTIDDYMQYFPVATMWLLDGFGVESRHGFKEQTTNLAMSCAFMAILVNSGKYTIRRLRPNNSTYNSFPSGHTATAFMGAEFLRMEYGQTSPLIGLVGYSFAFATGYMRIRRNKHYFTDVLAGAGVGILSVKLAYWCAPAVNRLLWNSDVRHRNSGSFTVVSPYSNGEQYGLGLSMRF
ncbi:MAG: phosphatase PAP2 family protein [Rikenellaceae bacterium]